MKIPIVNEQDEIIEYKERIGRNPEDIIRASGLWITDPEGNILLAQRAFSKKNDPGLWGPAVAGTVEEGETYESNIIKEAEEEIGLVGFVPTLAHKKRSLIKQFWGQWFTTIIEHDYVFKKQDEEVEKIQWFSRDELIKFFSQNPEVFVSGFVDEMKVFLNYEN